MLIITPEAYSPSDVMIYILYEQLSKELPEEAQRQMLYFTREQIRYAFAATLDAISEWQCCRNIFESEFWILDSDCYIREEVFREIRSRTDLHKDAEYDKYEFRLRFGEEVMNWFLRQPDEARRLGLKRGKHNRIVLVRKKLFDMRMPVDIDSTGCA